jgi:hypothetical protein
MFSRRCDERKNEKWGRNAQRDLTLEEKYVTKEYDRQACGHVFLDCRHIELYRRDLERTFSL